MTSRRLDLKIIALIVALAACAGIVQAAYSWYYVDYLTSISSTYWTQNGTLTSSASGTTSTTAGSLISKLTAPTYPNDYQVQSYINLPSGVNGGNYGVMFRASTNAMMSSTTATGSFYLLEIQNPTWSGGSCSATLVLSKSVSGSVTTLYSAATWCATSFAIIATVNGNNILLYQNGSYLAWVTDSSIAAGQPGINVRGVTGGGAMGLTVLGPGDKTAPNAIDSHLLSTSSYPNRIDMQWKGASDDVNGAGLALYRIYRDGSLVAAFPYHLGEFTDNAVLPSTTHSYVIQDCDLFGNCGSVTFSASTAPSGAVDPRQVGLKSTATNWGGGGENVNILSGNLNFSLPLLTAKGRGGMSAGVGLNYNSQNWRVDSAGTWNYGRDLGYGYGVKLGIGSMQMFYNANWGIDHWTFTDSTGTEYRLDKQVNQDGTTASTNTGIWATSTDGASFMYDSNSSLLWFPSGTRWSFGCSSRGLEGDETALYPTLIEDSNGNEILIRYKSGVAGLDNTGNNAYFGWPSSGRIDQIEDIRAVPVTGGYATYQFNYNNDPVVPHLTSITNNIGTSEGYSFSYGSVSLTSPWGAAVGFATQLSGITISGVGLGYTLSYDTTNSGTLSKVIYPYGGYLRWEYGDGNYSASRTQREVVNRYLSKDGATEVGPYSFFGITHDSSNTIRSFVTFNDPDGIGQKAWTFNTTGASMGLISRYQGGDRTLSRTLQQVDTTWSTAAFGPYISSTTTTMDPGQTFAVAKRVDQAVDQWGNLTSMTLYDYSGAARRTYTNTYLATSPYTTRYIRNRLLTSTVLEAGVTTPLVTNTYDVYQPGAIVNAAAVRQFDSGYTTSFQTRGNVTTSQKIGQTLYMTQFDNTGNVLQMSDQTGVNVTNGTTSTTNFAVPSAMTVGSLNSNFQYASSLLPTQNQGPNGDISSTVYDTYARPSSSTSKTGAITYFNYVNSPAQTLGYLNGRVSRTTLDGFGRTIKVESGTGTRNGTTGAISMGAVVSVVDSVYAPCGCSPLGKLSKVSRPYAPGGSVYWTL